MPGYAITYQSTWVILMIWESKKHTLIILIADFFFNITLTYALYVTILVR